MLFDRQKRLLALLDALGGHMGNLDFQKLLFIYCQEASDNPAYEFVPYKFGGFSFTSYADKRRLIEAGLLTDEERTWTLTPSGKKAAGVDFSVRLKIDQFAKRHTAFRGDSLVAEAYRRYPYYAINSEMASRVLNNDKETLQKIEAARPRQFTSGLFTIGYEGKSLEAYLNSMLKHGITLLCDVRKNPLSRKYGFSKLTLSKCCEGVGIRYEHLPELGIATEKRRELNTQADYDELFDEYERDHLPCQEISLKKIKNWLESGERVALTCFELSPHQCHRHCVAEKVETALKQRKTTTHL